MVAMRQRTLNTHLPLPKPRLEGHRSQIFSMSSKAKAKRRKQQQICGSGWVQWKGLWFRRCCFSPTSRDAAIN